MKIHHKGIAVCNIKNAKQKYMDLGYKFINEVYDENQKANLLLLQKDEEFIELINSSNEKSPVYNLCRQENEKIYHTCYEVKDIKANIEKLKKEGYMQISEIVSAKLFKGLICFMYSKKEGVIELYEVHI